MVDGTGRANTMALLEKLRLVHAVWATQPTIQQLLSARDFPGALDLISSSQQVIEFPSARALLMCVYSIVCGIGHNPIAPVVGH